MGIAILSRLYSNYANIERLLAAIERKRLRHSNVECRETSRLVANKDAAIGR